MIITIDGPAGTGKSTIAKSVAEALQITYFDTGALYRSIAWYIDQHEVSIDDQAAIEKLIENFEFNIKKENNHSTYFVGDTDVTAVIRTPQMSVLASQVGAKGYIRETLKPIQKAYAKTHDCVFEGRDLGTVVFPEADLKIFLSATPEIRAERRLNQLEEKHPEQVTDFDEILRQIKKRDQDDTTRSVAPLKQAKDAFYIDTSHLSASQVTQKVLLCLKPKRNCKPVCFHKKKVPFFYRFIIFSYWCWFKIFYKFQVYGLEHSYDGGAIIASNHVSFYDPPILAISYPEEVHFLARDTLFKSFLGFCISRLNTHPVKGDVTNLDVMKTICRLLKEGHKVVLFPEGTRSQENALGEIKPGIGMLIARTGTAIIPTYIHGNYEVWPRHRKLPKLGGAIACVYGSAITWESYKHLEKKEAQIAIAKQLEASIKALRKWYEDGAEGIPP